MAPLPGPGEGLTSRRVWSREDWFISTTQRFPGPPSTTTMLVTANGGSVLEIGIDWGFRVDRAGVAHRVGPGRGPGGVALGHGRLTPGLTEGVSRRHRRLTPSRCPRAISLLLQEVAVVGSLVYGPDDYEAVIANIAAGIYDTAGWVHHASLDELTSS